MSLEKEHFYNYDLFCNLYVLKLTTELKLFAWSTGIPIQDLDMNCDYSRREIPTWAVITIVAVPTTMLFCLIVLYKKYRQRRKRKLTHYDSLENLSEMKYDAFLSYR